MIRARVLAVLAVLVLPMRASAWDPSTTHVGMLERAAIDGDVHTRWMENSARTRGLFTPLRLDPAKLPADMRRRLELSLRHAHADSGAVALGGPGACPPIGSPPSTRARCVDADLWEATALGWMRLGIVLEVDPPARMLHHFVDGREPARATWRTHDVSRAWLRRVERRGGGSLAALVGRSGFAGTAQSAIAWLEDPRDPFAPPAMRERLRLASLAASPSERDHHLALALVGLGALLHVVQDLAVPAYARGDIAAMFVPLSPMPSDRGSPLSEYARLTFGRRAFPRTVELGTRPAEAAVVPADVRSLLLGGAHGEGLVHLAGRRFLAEGTMPTPRVVEETLTPEAAAAVLLADLAIPLDPVETEGARLTPWPADDGYLVTATGRPLAAWQRGPDGFVYPYADVHVLRSQALVTLPAAIAATEAVLDLVWPAWPDDAYDEEANTYELDAPPGLRAAQLHVVVEDTRGIRRRNRLVRLVPLGRSRIRDVVPTAIAKDARVVLVLEGHRPDGSVVVLERRLDAERAPRVEPSPPGDGKTPSPTEPVPTEPVPPEPVPTEPAPTDSIPGKPVPTEPAPIEPAPNGRDVTGTKPAPPAPGTPTTPPPTSPSVNGPMTEEPPDPPNKPER